MMQIDYVCPEPMDWNEICELLATEYQRSHKQASQTEGLEYWKEIGLPIPLILNGWVFSSDVEKHHRWLETLEWAKKNDLMWVINESNFKRHGLMTW